MKRYLLLFPFLFFYVITGAQTTDSSPYCLPQFSSPNNPYLIDTLLFDNTTELSNSSTKFNNSDYVYYNNLATLNVSAGVIHDLRLEGYAPASASATVWVDYNHDNIFEANEQLQSLSGFGNVFIEHLPFTVPTLAGNGITRMRVALTSGQLYGEYPCPTGVASDTTPVNGEYADYQINITGASASLPSITTDAALNVTSTLATLNGTANANGDSTDLVFQYGLTTNYTNTITPTPPKAGGTSTLAILAQLGGLQSNTVYHFRLSGTNTAGTANGNDMTFTTGPVGVQQVNNGAFSISPNPAKNIVKLTLPKNFANSQIGIEVFDMTGRRVIEKRSVSNHQFNVTNLQSGIYAVKIFTDGQPSTVIELMVQ